MSEVFGPFGVIAIDPPWLYSQFRDAANGAAKSAMTCMTVEAIAAVPVGFWAAENSVLALWITGTKLAEGAHVELCRAWGFTPKTILPWMKNSPSKADLSTGVGIWFQGCCEYIVFAVRGDVGGFFTAKDGKVERARQAPLGALCGERDEPAFWKRVSETALMAPKDRKHSRKPEKLQDYLETFPGPYLELFARRERPGWTAFGYGLGYELGPWGVRERPKLRTVEM